MLRLSSKDLSVLGAVELRANRPMSEIRKATGFRDHTIRYTLKRLCERKVITKKPFINAYLLGYSDYAIYFSIASKREAEVGKLISHLTLSPRVSWIARVGGDYQYRLSVCAKQHSDVLRFLDQTAETFPAMFFEKVVSLRVSLTLFERAYLRGGGASQQSIGFGASETQVEIDEKDRLILSALESLDYASFRALSRKLSIPIATLEGRLKRLEERKVIVGYTYQVDCTKYGMQHYSMLIYAKGISVKLRKLLYQFASQHPHITYFLECLGSWDYELGLEVADGEKAAFVTQEIYDALGEHINTIRLMPVFSHLKQRNFPFESSAK